MLTKTSANVSATVTDILAMSVKASAAKIISAVAESCANWQAAAEQFGSSVAAGLAAVSGIKTAVARRRVAAF